MIRFCQLAAVALLAGTIPIAAPAAPASNSGRVPVKAVTATPRQEVPGIVLIGMGLTGFAIVGFAARRRQPGQSVSS